MVLLRAHVRARRNTSRRSRLICLRKCSSLCHANAVICEEVEQHALMHRTYTRRIPLGDGQGNAVYPNVGHLIAEVVIGHAR